MSSLKLPKVGLDEIKKKKVAFAKELAAEFLGTMLLVMIGCGSAMSGDNDDGEGQLGRRHRNVDNIAGVLNLCHYSGEQAQYVRIALAFGLAVATIAQACTKTYFPIKMTPFLSVLTCRLWDTFLVVTSTLLSQLDWWLEPRLVF